jgi:hypothetical protein
VTYKPLENTGGVVTGLTVHDVLHLFTEVNAFDALSPSY